MASIGGSLRQVRFCRRKPRRAFSGAILGDSRTLVASQLKAPLLRHQLVDPPADTGPLTSGPRKPIAKYEAAILKFLASNRFKNDQYIQIRQLKSLREAGKNSHVMSGIGLMYIEITQIANCDNNIKTIRYPKLEDPKDVLESIYIYARENPGKPLSGYLKKLIYDLEKNNSQTIAKSWVDFVDYGQPASETNAESISNADLLPESAPARWLEEPSPETEDDAAFKARRAVEKPIGDTPPEFIKRHYGGWLNSDGTGLTRPDIKRLDPSLYMALANWLRKNELPADCPLPTKTHAITSTLNSLLSQPEIDDTALRRLGDAARYRERKHRGNRTTNARD